MDQALETPVVRVRGDVVTATRDRVAIERALQIRVRIGDDERVLSTTMRTPGDDVALAVGFLHGEGVLAGAGALRGAEQLGDDSVRVELAAEAAAALAASERAFVTSAACGVCGRTSLDGLASCGGNLVDDGGGVTAAVIHRLPDALRAAQAAFVSTGGLHAAALFSLSGDLLAAHEDVGRHNAVDKLVGRLLLAGKLPLSRAVLMLSGRASFELVQKAEAAGIPIVAAVGAPSSLAVERAAAAGMTLLGFVRDGGFNVYCGAARVAGLNDANVV
ncbi:MAG TPA: formate dehydrogenase accessory sulfurtransferase FdhD [Polyangia bacterium]|nr:formate dehydrogenase accessory sulfurtransferase FdhD [Polyangia bacterium]